MNKRNLFLGLGIGLILSSIIFYIGFICFITPVRELSDEDIILKAKELNMILADEIPEQETLSDEDIILKAKELGMIFESDINDETVEPESTTDNPNKEDIQPTTLNTQAEVEVEIVDVRILPGSSAINVSKTLYEAGVIEDADSFLNFLKQSNKANTIRAGYFKIPKGSSQQDILKILTTPPKKQTR